MDEVPTDDRSFAERLRLLMTGKQNPSTGRNYTYAEVIAGIDRRSAELGLSAEAADARRMSQQYLGQLINGVRDNPTLHRIRALADFFDVPTDYFTTDQFAARLEDLRLRDALGQQGMAEIVFRARGLSSESLEWAAAMLDHARKLEGLEKSSADGDGAGQ